MREINGEPKAFLLSPTAVNPFARLAKQNVNPIFRRVFYIF
jgi:hypothetical protein